ncbi:hypothetical protein HanRHA438_Chr04g0189851 [Helianthus annuus]|nr:hypothetical protein HanRHA438_Chr04g0189851 [Helianthus annuus]
MFELEVAWRSVSIKNSPPLSAFMRISDINSSPPSCPSDKRWKRMKMESFVPPRSRQASSLPHGSQLSGRKASGRTINHEPGFDRAT